MIELFSRRHRIPDRLCLGFVLPVIASTLSVLAQQAPPTLKSVVPHGGQRGSTVSLLLDGTNLGGTKRLLFERSGFEASIVERDTLPNVQELMEGETRPLILDKSTKDRLTVEVRIDPDLRPGVYSFRLDTALGVTNALSFAVGPFSEVNETQVNNRLDQAQEVELPATVRGDISDPGDVDHFRFEARRGQELVFEVFASPLGSILNSTLVLRDREGKIRARSRPDGGSDVVLIYRVEEDGKYIIGVKDQNMGGAMQGYHYRLRMGEYPFLTEVSALGVRAGRETSLEVSGANLKENRSVKVAPQKTGWGETYLVSVDPAWNEIPLAVGAYREESEQEPNDSLAASQTVDWPLTLNGHIQTSASQESGSAGADADLFRFSAKKGQELVIEVDAERLGSSLDSVLEIWDAEGNLLPQATVRCLAKTEIVLKDSETKRGSMRLQSWEDLAIDDYVMVGSEIVQISALPRGPDDDVRFKTFLGTRLTLLGTTPEVHAMGDPVYKVRIFPPGSTFPPNGMPVFHLNYRNDDGGPMYGGDSRLDFTVPEDGSYLVRIRDIRGFEGKRYPYRLTIREKTPGFQLVSSPMRTRGRIDLGATRQQHFNLSPGGQVTADVNVVRLDGFDGEIEVMVEELPSGVTATRGLIPAGASSTVVLLQASEDAAFEPTQIHFSGRATIEGRAIVHRLDEGRDTTLVALSGPADLAVSVDAPNVNIIPGSEVKVTVHVSRQQGFESRVPVDIRNLPFGVRVLDVGLNGILVTEEESSRTFTLYAEPWVEPLEQTIFAVGRVETTSSLPVQHSSGPISLKVIAREAEGSL